MKTEELVETLDYYIDQTSGRWVFTAHYLSKRGYCCKNACRHCPFGYTKDAVGCLKKNSPNLVKSIEQVVSCPTPKDFEPRLPDFME